MPIKYLKWITREMLRAEPEARFVFGDNTQRIGMGGQAGSMRGEPNAIGVATKRTPSMDPNAFFSDRDTGDRLTLLDDLLKVERALDEGRTVYVPKDGLGTGLSQLPDRAPKLYQTIIKFFDDKGDAPCPWPRQ